MKPSQNKKRLHVMFVSENRITLRSRDEDKVFHTNVNLSANTTKPPEALNQLSSLKTHLHLEEKAHFSTCANKKGNTRRVIGDGMNAEAAVETAGVLRYVGGGG